jgi:hypothetical protein
MTLDTKTKKLEVHGTWWRTHNKKFMLPKEGGGRSPNFTEEEAQEIVSQLRGEEWRGIEEITDTKYVLVNYKTHEFYVHLSGNPNHSTVSIPLSWEGKYIRTTNSKEIANFE